jgi:hypothetical protein
MECCSCLNVIIPVALEYEPQVHTFLARNKYTSQKSTRLKEKLLLMERQTFRYMGYHIQTLTNKLDNEHQTATTMNTAHEVDQLKGKTVARTYTSVCL